MFAIVTSSVEFWISYRAFRKKSTCLIIALRGRLINLPDAATRDPSGRERVEAMIQVGLRNDRVFWSLRRDLRLGRQGARLFRSWCSGFLSRQFINPYQYQCFTPGRIARMGLSCFSKAAPNDLGSQTEIRFYSRVRLCSVDCSTESAGVRRGA